MNLTVLPRKEYPSLPHVLIYFVGGLLNLQKHLNYWIVGVLLFGHFQIELGCTEKKRFGELIREHKIAADELRKKLTQIKQSIDSSPTPKVDSSCHPPGNLFVHHYKNEAPATVEVVSYDLLLLQGDQPAEEPELDFYLSSNIKNFLTWTHPSYSFADGDFNEEVDGNIFDWTKSLHYLLVIKPGRIDWKRPWADHPEQKSPGISMNAFLVDLDKQTILCSLQAEAHSASGRGWVQRDLIETNKTTGEEKVVESTWSNEDKSRLWTEARDVLRKGVKSTFGFDPFPDP